MVDFEDNFEKLKSKYCTEHAKLAPIETKLVFT